MASGITIKVDPAILQAKAQIITGRITKVENELKAIRDQVNASKSYWEGDASNTHQKRFKELEDDISSVIKELKAHPRNLLTMAGLYKTTEAQLQAEANSLPMDVIS